MVIFSQFYLTPEQQRALEEAERNSDRERGVQLLEKYIESLPVITRTHNQGKSPQYSVSITLTFTQ